MTDLREVRGRLEATIARWRHCMREEAKKTPGYSRSDHWKSRKVPQSLQYWNYNNVSQLEQLLECVLLSPTPLQAVRPARFCICSQSPRHPPLMQVRQLGPRRQWLLCAADRALPRRLRDLASRGCDRTPLQDKGTSGGAQPPSELAVSRSGPPFASGNVDRICAIDAKGHSPRAGRAFLVAPL